MLPGCRRRQGRLDKQGGAAVLGGGKRAEIHIYQLA